MHRRMQACTDEFVAMVTKGVVCSVLIQSNSEKVANTRKYWIARPDSAKIFNIFWYWQHLRSLAVVNPTLYPI